MATTPSTELDFDQIKQSIITFIKSNPTFTDYDFEGSSLNAIIDILAMNTHTNAYLASMGHSERFLDTAQRRGSVVSRAKEMGYMPRSAVCSTAFIDVTAYDASGVQLLSRGTAFTSSNDNGSYNFLVADDSTSNTSGGNQIFSNLKIIDGYRVQNTFTVDTTSNIRSIFTIPNQNIDTSTLKLYVRDSAMSVGRTEYSLAEDVYELKSSSKVYFLQESYDGSYQIYFGGDVLGSQPVNGNVIDIDYFVTKNYGDSNGCTIFGFNGTIDNASSILINTVQVAFGGADKEDITSIKVNAKKSNSAKERSVTVPDYELALIELFDFIKSVSVWGGEDNIPPVYGKVFISVQPVAGYTISDAIKRDVLTPAIRKKSMLVVIPEFVDPNYLILEFDTSLKFNASQSTSTQQYVEAGVKTAVNNYVNSISKFNSDLLHINLTASMKAVDPGIISLSTTKRVGFKVSPLIGVTTTYSRSINNPIEAGTIGSTKFNVLNGIVSSLVTIREITGKFTSIIGTKGDTQTVQSLGMYTDTGELVSEIGSVNMSSGQFDFAFAVLSYLTANRFVQISCKLKSEDIITARNQILTMDTVSEDTTIGLSNNNRVTTEIYTK